MSYNHSASQANAQLEKESRPTSAQHQKKLFIKSYGCQMNVYDAERMSDVMANQGYQTTQNMEEADLVLLNTCHIREKAAEKVYSEIGRIRKIRDKREDQSAAMMIGVAGCVAQAEGEEMMARAPAIDLIVGPQSYHNLPELVQKAQNGSKAIDIQFPSDDKFDHMPQAKPAIIQKRGPAAFLTIQEGCDKFCTFCVVPYTRGAEVSRPVAALMNEARNLVAAGVKEITLLGQNVNAYHGEGYDGQSWSLGQLLHEMAKIDGLKRLRYTTSHPRDMHDELMEAHRDLPILMPYLHLPVQSGSDAILKAMNRHHTRDDYRRIIEKMRTIRSDIALSGDFIVGFPGETDQDFDDTLSLVDEIGYAQAFSFKYSTRPGTPGALMENQIDEAVKTERLMTLQELLRKQQQQFLQSRVDMTMDVLLEKKGKKEGQLVGRSPWLQPVNIDAPFSLLGELVTVHITHAGTNSLFAKLTSSDYTHHKDVAVHA
jgi:tRNA-2-methylthio-N6-dimethylallyladenosine synthase